MELEGQGGKNYDRWDCKEIICTLRSGRDNLYL